MTVTEFIDALPEPDRTELQRFARAVTTGTRLNFSYSKSGNEYFVVDFATGRYSVVVDPEKGIYTA